MQSTQILLFSALTRARLVSSELPFDSGLTKLSQLFSLSDVPRFVLLLFSYPRTALSGLAIFCSAASRSFSSFSFFLAGSSLSFCFCLSSSVSFQLEALPSRQKYGSQYSASNQIAITKDRPTVDTMQTWLLLPCSHSCGSAAFLPLPTKRHPRTHNPARNHLFSPHCVLSLS